MIAHFFTRPLFFKGDYAFAKSLFMLFHYNRLLKRLCTGLFLSCLKKLFKTALLFLFGNNRLTVKTFNFGNVHTAYGSLNFLFNRNIIKNLVITDKLHYLWTYLCLNNTDLCASHNLLTPVTPIEDTT